MHESPDGDTWGGHTNPRGIGRCYRKLKEFNLSEEHFLDILKLDPFHPKTHYELGLLYHDMKNKEKAIEHIEIALDIWKGADELFSLAKDAKKKLEKWST